MTTAAATTEQPRTTPSTAGEATVLVCASPGPDGAPQVVLADGSYETEAERVFWRRTPGTEVLRVPLQARVTVRPVRHFSSPAIPAKEGPEQQGEQRLLAALAPHLPVPEQRTTPDTPVDPVNARLSAALTSGEVGKAEAMTALLWRREGLARAHATVAACLAEGPERRSGADGVLPERTAAATARALLERLRALSPEPSPPATGVTTGRRVVLAVPPGDPHTMVLTALAHQLQEAGYAVLVVEDAPVTELAGLIVREQPLAVVVSAHLPWPVAAARSFLGALRSASPDTLLVLGGPGAPTSVPRADLVTSNAQVLLDALRTRSGALTPREREVLLAVADGRTTNEIAQSLGLSPATVRTHLDHVFTKTGTEHRAAAVARALRQGWIS